MAQFVIVEANFPPPASSRVVDNRLVQTFVAGELSFQLSIFVDGGELSGTVNTEEMREWVELFAGRGEEIVIA